MKLYRWYDVTINEDGEKTLNVYSSPIKDKSEFSSHVNIKDMSYYRNTFNLRKVWTEQEIEKNNYILS